MVDCTGLENRQTETSQGFESLSLRMTLGCSPAATRADCKSAAFRLRRFESYHPNDMEFVAQLVERLFVAQVVAGSKPVKLPTRFISSVGRAAHF